MLNYQISQYYNQYMKVISNSTQYQRKTKALVFPHITSGALISAAQLRDHGCIATFTNTYDHVQQTNGISN